MLFATGDWSSSRDTFTRSMQSMCVLCIYVKNQRVYRILIAGPIAYMLYVICVLYEDELDLLLNN